MNRRYLLLLAASGLLLPAPGRAQLAAPVTGFLNRSLLVDGEARPYVVYVPRDYSAAKRWPVILFLHGSGERGADGLKQTQVGIGAAIRFFPERFPAIVVMPQCAPGQRWDGAMATFAVQALDQTVTEYNGDPDRLYLTGLSMGSGGSWLIASEQPQKFAAVVPICGRGEIPLIAEKLKRTPVWVFVGDQDRAETVRFSQQVVDALKSAGNPNVRYTEYPGVPHNSWDKAYAERDLAEWLFAQKRSR
jgi:predicted peptidase